MINGLPRYECLTDQEGNPFLVVPPYGSKDLREICCGDCFTPLDTEDGEQWQDINFEKGILQVSRTLTRIPSRMEGRGYMEAEPKTQRSRRSIVVASFALESLKRHRKRQLEAKLKAGELWQDHDYVFCTSVGTHLNPTRDILDQLKFLLKKAGLPDMRFHDLRHCAATLLLSEGVHPKIVQEILGHSNIAITLDIYSHMLPTMHGGAPGRLDDLLGE